MCWVWVERELGFVRAIGECRERKCEGGGKTEGRERERG